MTAIPTCLVQATIRGQDGEPLPGAIVTAVLDRTERYQGYVVPSRIQVTTDDSGQVEIPLFPNVLGAHGSQYRITARGPDKRLALDVTATVPDEASAELYVIADHGPPPTLTDAEIALQGAQTAASEAHTHRLSAEGAADTATTKAGLASGHEAAAIQAKQDAQQALYETGLVKASVLADRDIVIEVKGDVETLKSQTETARDTAVDTVNNALGDIETARSGAVGDVGDARTTALDDIGTDRNQALIDIGAQRTQSLDAIGDAETASINAITPLVQAAESAESAATHQAGQAGSSATAAQQARTEVEQLYGDLEAVDEAVLFSAANRALVNLEATAALVAIELERIEAIDSIAADRQAVADDRLAVAEDRSAVQELRDSTAVDRGIAQSAANAAGEQAGDALTLRNETSALRNETWQDRQDVAADKSAVVILRSETETDRGLTQTARNEAEEWATGTEPGGPGTKSAREHSEDADSRATAAQQAQQGAEALFGDLQAIDEAVLLTYANRAYVDTAIAHNLVILEGAA